MVLLNWSDAREMEVFWLVFMKYSVPWGRLPTSHLCLINLLPIFTIFNLRYKIQTRNSASVKEDLYKTLPTPVNPSSSYYDIRMLTQAQNSGRYTQENNLTCVFPPVHHVTSHPFVPHHPRTQSRTDRAALRLHGAEDRWGRSQHQTGLTSAMCGQQWRCWFPRA